jgi:hypothetical protein
VKFCQVHWESLREAIRERGLWGFVADGGEEAMKRSLGENATDRANFEPLMGAHNAIVSRAIDVVGLALLVANEDGSEKCPICFLQQSHDVACKVPDCKQNFAKWIDYAADGSKNEAIRLGLLATS